MSYSFSVRAGSKDEAKAGFAAKFDEVVANQAIHEKDKTAALQHASNLLDLVEVMDGYDIVIDAYGSVGWRNDSSDSPAILTSASSSVSIYQVTKTEVRI